MDSHAVIASLPVTGADRTVLIDAANAAFERIIERGAANEELTRSYWDAESYIDNEITAVEQQCGQVKFDRVDRRQSERSSGEGFAGPAEGKELVCRLSVFLSQFVNLLRRRQLARILAFFNCHFHGPLPSSVISIPCQLDVRKCPFSPPAVGGTLPGRTLVEAGLPLELHEPGRGFGLATCRGLNPADDAAVRPTFMWIGKRSRIGEVPAKRLQRDVFRCLK